MRLFVHPNLDGILCAAMIMDMEGEREVIFSDAREVKKGWVEIKEGDIVANLPYHDNCAIWFNSTTVETEIPEGVKGKVGDAPSSAKLVYEYYDSTKLEKYDDILEELDRLGSGNFSYVDVLHPTGWILLGFTLDRRSGMEEISDYNYMVLEAIKKMEGIDSILNNLAVKERINRFISEEENFKKILVAHTHTKNNISITDYRKLNLVPMGNRFLVFALNSRSNVNIRIFHDRREADHIVIEIVKSAFFIDHPLYHNENIGKMMTEYGGSGSERSGICSVKADSARGTIHKIISRLKMKMGHELGPVR
ncbi:MAG: hypothetical protein P9L92_19920 [Candidatus Electryonea clarkiae]|nr:hypothetical protein [Candidatus Electryonea clarkiae]